MSEAQSDVKEEVKVTSSKPKDPKKVEAGKRLGALSKELRERKMRERMQAEDINNKLLVLTVVSVVVAVVGVVFTVKSYFFQTSPEAPAPRQAQAKAPTPITPPTTPPPKKKPPRPSNLITLDE